MEAPDSVYLDIPGGYWYFKTGKNVNTDHEYIRKDALLEWANAVKADPMIPMNIDKVIEKIESL